MQGHDLLSFVPLHLGALEREPMLHSWVDSWFKVVGPFLWLNSLGWYTEAHCPGCFLWAPLPAAADAALDQLA